MNAIIQTVLNYSQLDITLIRITDAHPDDFLMSIECMITKTGPISSLMSTMTCDLIGSEGLFGRLDLPELTTKPSGTLLVVPEQRIQIINKDAFLAFVKAIQTQEKVFLRLDNGKATVKAMGMRSSVVYHKDLTFNGMNGPEITLQDVKSTPDIVETTITIKNPSPVEIDLGESMFDVVAEGSKDVIAHQSGNISIKRGDTRHNLSGKRVKTDKDAKLRVLGVDSASDSWLKTTIHDINVPIQSAPKLRLALAGGDV